jgi:hypothetical protein
MFLVSLGDSSMRLGVPFIAPRQLGAVEDQQGRLSLPSIEWRTGQSGAPLDSHCRRSGADLLPFLAQMTIASLGQLAHRTLSHHDRFYPTFGYSPYTTSYPNLDIKQRLSPGKESSDHNQLLAYSFC